MRYIGLGIFVLASLLPVSPALAQLELSLKLEHPSLLRFEPMNAFLTIHNDWAEPFVIDTETESNVAKVTFTMTRQNQRAVPRIEDRPFVRKLRLLPDEKRDLVLDLSEWFEVTPMGRYLVEASVVWGAQRFDSGCVMVEVVRGIEITQVTKSLPGTPPRVRTYSLRYWPRGKTERLFISIDEESSNLNYGVFELGPVVRVYRPVLDVGRDGLVKVIHQSGVDCYTRSVFRSLRGGVRFMDQTYHLSSGDPYPRKSAGDEGGAAAADREAPAKE